MTQANMGNYEASWGQYGADEWSDALVASMKLGGVDNLFFVSGSEIAFWQESIAKAKDREWPAPRLVTVTHEGVALNAAAGDAMVSGKPSATAVHVDVGTLNFGAAIHTVWRGSYPVLMTAGTGPRAFPDSLTGGRDSPVQWVQEPRDQGEILRQYTKVDHRLEHQDNPGLMISRLLQVAMSEPKGPVYLTIPREVAMQRLPGAARFPTRDQMGLARPAWPDPTDARRAAEWLIKADNPLLCLAKSGRNPETVGHVVRLAELLALPVNENHTDRLNFPTPHPLLGTGPAAKDAAAQAIYEAATSMLTTSDISRIADRRARLDERKREMVAAAEEAALKSGQRNPLHPRWVAYQLGKILEPETILLDDALSNAPLVQTYRSRTQPSTYFKSGGSSGGWGSGAAFGAKLARPQSDVILASGDGYFMFGTPMAALWAAAHHGAPFLSVVFVNRSYSTGTRGLRGTYPDGSAISAGNYDGGLFDPPPDFAKMAEAANSYGETVHEPEEVGPALRRGLEQVRNGTPAVVAVMLPTLVEEMSR